MKTQFKITGLYYEIQGYKFRKYLDIQKINSSRKTPDVIVVLMNPGGSRPINGIDNANKATEAIPDRTQNKVIQVMINAEFEYARVLNLSDIREPKSNIFYKTMIELESKGIAHSIFDDSRKEDFNNLWVPNTPVIYGFGVSIHLKSLALKAIATCNASNPYGILKANTTWAYYPPLPPVHSRQQEWVKEVSKQLNT